MVGGSSGVLCRCWWCRWCWWCRLVVLTVIQVVPVVLGGSRNHPEIIQAVYLSPAEAEAMRTTNSENKIRRLEV